MESGASCSGLLEAHLATFSVQEGPQRLLKEWPSCWQRRPVSHSASSWSRASPAAPGSRILVVVMIIIIIMTIIIILIIII